MKIQPADIARSEFIGLEVEVIDAENKALIGLKGLVVDETKSLLIIEQDGVAKKVIKSQVTLKVLIEGQEFQIDGKILMGRPEDRLKKLRRIR